MQDRAPDEITKQLSDKINALLEKRGFRRGMRKLCGRRFFVKKEFEHGCDTNTSRRAGFPTCVFVPVWKKSVLAGASESL